MIVSSHMVCPLHLDVAFLLAESKRITDINEADMSKTMIQASDLKDQLENQGTACNAH